jgi:hypothetical protein
MIEIPKDARICVAGDTGLVGPEAALHTVTLRSETTKGSPEPA